MVNSAGSNPAVRTNAIVAQLAGGAALKTRIVRVRIPPMAPRWRSPTAEAASLNLVPVSVQIGPPARVPFRSAGRNPADYENRAAGVERFNSSGTHHTLWCELNT